MDQLEPRFTRLSDVAFCNAVLGVFTDRYCGSAVDGASDVVDSPVNIDVPYLESLRLR